MLLKTFVSSVQRMLVDPDMDISLVDMRDRMTMDLSIFSMIQRKGPMSIIVRMTKSSMDMLMEQILVFRIFQESAFKSQQIELCQIFQPFHLIHFS